MDIDKNSDNNIDKDSDMNLQQPPTHRRVQRLGIVLVVLAGAISNLASNFVSAPDDEEAVTVPPAVISTQPADQNVTVGATAEFRVATSGLVSSYQWQRSSDGTTWSAIADASSPTYTVIATTALSGTQYRVVVAGPTSTVTSSAVRLTVSMAVVAPAVLVDVAPVSTVAGADATFTVTASGTSVAYQWQSSTDGSTWAAVTGATGATSATLRLGSVALADNGKRFRVLLSNSAGSVTSSVAVLTVTAAPVVPAAPGVALAPVDASVVAPTPANFTVTATGTAPVTYQWQKSSDGGSTYSDIALAIAAGYTTPVTAVADSGALFRVRITNASGTATSSAARLTVAPAAVAPAFTLAPRSVAVTAPAAATFSTAVSGNPQPALQWQLSVDNGASFANINGATAASYTTPATALADSGRQYRAVAANASGSVTSATAVLTVSAAAGTGVVPAPIVLSAGQYHSCALQPDGTVACWGANGFGAVTGMFTDDRLSPTTLTLPVGVASLWSGSVSSHSCAIKLDTTVYCWGPNSYGILGNPAVGPGAGRTAVAGLDGVVALALGSVHGCALKADGTVSCWGSNQLGQLGDGTLTTRATAAVVPGLSGVVALTAGGNHTCAAKSDGNVVCWGFNFAGQLGDASTVDKRVPTAVVGLSRVIALGAGDMHTCAIVAGATGTSPNTLSCWGNGDDARLGVYVLGGTGSGHDQHTPVTVPGVSGVISLGVGGRHTCVVRADGTVACWGREDKGQITYSPASPANASIRVLSLTGMRKVVAGWEHTCAMSASGSVLCWGGNVYGQLGTGSTTDNPTPSLVPGLTAKH